ncbi:hypothetical protein KUTeg_012085 [Tegillarca granosa]|uniref:Uncharacterized protein n=1 Tax=Tegillarca granosa TaxID=220873 RepID=A0ABQ9EYI7_TEGGR|nr:hypothetical protein KUTeg_012085 [Tegillarca granosa]
MFVNKNKMMMLLIYFKCNALSCFYVKKKSGTSHYIILNNGLFNALYIYIYIYIYSPYIVSYQRAYIKYNVLIIFITGLNNYHIALNLLLNERLFFAELFSHLLHLQLHCITDMTYS